MLAVVIEITSYLHHVTPTKYENRETIETKDTCFWEERFIDRSFLLLEILKAEILCPTPATPRHPLPSPSWKNKSQKAMGNRVKSSA